MALTTTDAVIVELYDNPLTERTDDRYGRVVNVASVNDEVLLARAIANGFNGNAESMRATLRAVDAEAMKAVARSEIVNYGLGHIALDTNAVFIGDAPVWDPEKDRLVARITPSKALREALKSTPVRILGMAPDNSVISFVTDVTTGKVNETLTLGGMVNLRGSRVKIVGNKPGIGLWLTNVDTQEEVEVPSTAIGMNDPKRISFVVPATLAAGNYILSIVTQFVNGSTLLKEPRTLRLGYVLAAE
jgi:hypothetical protein